LNAGEGLPQVLQRLLGQQPGLVLERLSLLGDTPVATSAPTQAAPAGGMPQPASAPAAQRPVLPDMPGLSWQGVELQVQGSYRDIQRDLQLLERELPGLRWGEMRLSAAGPGEPPRLVVQVFLLKVQP
jgi:MSHA biogenesis protein MshJ